MNIKIVSKDLEATEAIKDYIAKKMERVEKYFGDTELNVNVTIRIERENQVADIYFSERGRTYKASSDEKDLYAQMIKFAELTGNTELKNRAERMQTNKADDDAAIAAGNKPGFLSQWFGGLRPGKTNGAYGYENNMKYQDYNSTGGHAFDSRYQALPKATTVAFNNLTTALNNFSSKPIQTNSTISLNGTVNLQQPNYGATNLIAELQKNPTLLNQFIDLMSTQTSINANGGKPIGSVPGAPR